jgi:hypothetical protein
MPEMTALVPCPVCGKSAEYTINFGSTFKWRRLTCMACGIHEPEVRATADFDAEWNRVGAYAAGLAAEVARLTDELTTCCELKREYQAREAAAVDGLARLTEAPR